MSPPGKKTNNKKAKPRPTLDSIANAKLEEEFQVIEEDPDSVSCSSDSEEERLIQNGGAVEDSEEMLERVRKIESLPIGFKDFLSTLDFQMLGLFVKCMLGFFFASLILSLIFLIFVFFFNEDLWFEYFPVSDDLEPSSPFKFEL